MHSSLFITCLSALLAVPSSVLGAPSGNPRAPVLSTFDISRISTVQLESPSQFDRRANVTDHGVGVNWLCTNSTGPDPLDCPTAIGQWEELGTNDKPLNITIPAGRCVSIENNSCMAFACAPNEDVYVSSQIVSSRLMNPLQTRCVSIGKGGVWGDGPYGTLNSTDLKIGLLESVFVNLPRKN